MMFNRYTLDSAGVNFCVKSTRRNELEEAAAAVFPSEGLLYAHVCS